jgi:hypothetical protein
MKRFLTLSMLAVFVLVASTQFSFAQEDGFKSLFDGKSLSGWDGDPKFWSIKDGAITGITTKENPTKGNTFAIYVGDSKDKTPVEYGDFELKLQFRIVGHNSGVQYRSFKLPGDNDGWRIGGYQADFDAKRQWAGTNYGEKFRGILAKRGEKATLTAGAKGKVQRKVESIGDSAELAKKIKDAPEWNDYHIIAKGNHLIQMINGVIMSEVIDNDEKNFRAKGLIALQLHGGPPMTVQFKNIRIKTK